MAREAEKSGEETTQASEKAQQAIKGIGDEADNTSKKVVQSASDSGQGMSKLVSAAIVAAPALGRYRHCRRRRRHRPRWCVRCRRPRVGCVRVGGQRAADHGQGSSHDRDRRRTAADGCVAEGEQRLSPHPFLLNGLNLLPKVLNLATPLVTATGRALQGLEGSISKSIGSPYWQSFSKLLGGQAGAAVSSFGNLLGGTVKMLSGLDIAFSPLIASMEHGIGDLGTKLAAFGAHAITSGGIASFAAWVEREGPVVGHLLLNLGSAVSAVIRDMGPIATLQLGGLNLFGESSHGDRQRVPPDSSRSAAQCLLWRVPDRRLGSPGRTSRASPPTFPGCRRC